MEIHMGANPAKVETHTGPQTLRETGLTLVHPFFDEPERFKLQFRNWLSWPEEVKDRVQIVLVDDCSPRPVHQYLTASQLRQVSRLNLSIYRITTNLIYNTPGAINLGFKVAKTPFVMMMDSDCTFDAKNIAKFLDAAPHTDTIYKFNRKRFGGDIPQGGILDGTGHVHMVDDLKNTRFLPCSMLMHQDIFWDLGGFDEDFTGAWNNGGYGYFDTDFDRRVGLSRYHWGVWADVTATEWMPSAAGGEIISRTERQQRRNLGLYRRKKSDWAGEPQIPQNRNILRFKWERTFESTRDSFQSLA
jgi:glycosyltransferase involved in cell wall biosynthesis